VNLKYYILNAEHHAVEASLLEWAKWFEEISNRLVGYTQVTSEISVSTVFLGIDHRWHDDGPPLLFETMIFGGPLDKKMWRYSSWDDAEAGHAAAVRKARTAIPGQRAEPGPSVTYPHRSVGNATMDLEVIRQEHIEALRGREVILLVKTDYGWNVEHWLDSGGIAPTTGYDTPAEATARVLQLLGLTGPVTSQNWPEAVGIGDNPGPPPRPKQARHGGPKETLRAKVERYERGIKKIEEYLCEKEPRVGDATYICMALLAR
jgi:hypothetical protein